MLGKISIGAVAPVVLVGGMLMGATPANAATAKTASASVSAQAATRLAGPPPGFNVKWFCQFKVVRNYIPACSNGRWEFKQIKIARCIVGHGPYVGLGGVAKLTYRVGKCAKGDWKKW